MRLRQVPTAVYVKEKGKEKTQHVCVKSARPPHAVGELTTKKEKEKEKEKEKRKMSACVKSPRQPHVVGKLSIKKKEKRKKKKEK